MQIKSLAAALVLACAAANVQAQTDTAGSAPATPKKACSANADCTVSGSYCNTSPGCAPKAKGYCEKKPEICTEDVKPVVGCDGKTYSNACKAAAAGVSVDGKAKK